MASSDSKGAVSSSRSSSYGNPVSGSKTEQRGRKAHDRISNEIVELCEIIELQGASPAAGEVGVCQIPFGRLFEIYTRISNKVVGVLLRARRHGLVHFEGETLFQRRDDHVAVTLLKPTEDIRREMREREKEFTWGQCM